MLVDKTTLLIGVLFLTAAQAGAWFQLSGQFIWDWCKKHELLMIVVPSIPISFLYVYSAKYIIKSFNGVMWPSRFISFGVGTVIFALLVYLLNNEGITPKTAVSLVLAFLLIIIQVLWK
jgi:hypothetical protein|tara:strand:+ start:2967 stop:3323 length:357 start_codon:yes stop_codon:yes gene_type:complete